MLRILLFLAALLLPATGGAMGLLDIRLASMAQKQEHHAIIRTLQPVLDRKESLPSARLMYLAGAYSETRNYARLFPACDLWQAQIERGDKWMVGGDLTAMPHFVRANAYLDLGDLDRALQEAQAADAVLARQSVATNSFLDSFHIETWGALGVTQALLRHTAEAEACLDLLGTVDVSGSINGPQKFAAMARIHMALGHPARALTALQDPKAEYHGLASAFYDKTFQRIPIAFLQARCQMETGRPDLAKAGYDGLLKHPHLAEIGGLHWQVLLDRARLARGEGQDPLAEELLRKAVDIIEGQRASIATEAARIGFVGDKQLCYQELVALLAKANRAAEAFTFVERAKGRALVDLLATQKLARPAQAEALGRLDAADRELQAIPDPAAPGTRGIAVIARRDLVRQAPELASLVIVPEVKAAELQSRLAPDETLLEYYAAGSQWLAFVATRETLTVTRLEAGNLDAAVCKLRRTLSDPAQDPSAAAAQLHAMLLDPVVPQLKTGRLTIVPHGVLHYVPFCALGTLLDRFTIRILPSATVLAFLKPGKPAGASLILGNPDLGDPALDLPFAQEEAVALARILPEPALRLRREATAEQMTRGAGQYGLIHLAAHGTFDDEHPLDSMLLLARGNLRAADLYRLDLDADLVTLSACDTALSKVSRGDDVVGFTRGLLYAGARSVLSSLWKVDDQCTRDLMVDFYTQLPALGKAAALRHAQMLVRKAHPHPYYWAAFLLTGRAE